MDEKKKGKRGGWQQAVTMVLLLAICLGGGFLLGRYLGQGGEKSTGEALLSLGVLLLGLYAALFVQLILHEAGHLVFGLLSGYEFSSFRIFSFMWVKESGTVKFKRLTIAGTGGQCLMAPPDLVDGKMPVILYNLGGSLMNVISGLLFLGLYFVFAEVPYVSVWTLLFAVIGFALALMNGVPMRTGTVDNDGYNAWSLSRDKGALRAFWVQMKANEQTARGVRIKDMPAEWFSVPTDEEMKNSMVAVMGVLASSRLMDEMKFEEADKLMEHLLEIDSGIVGLHRGLMVCDRVYLELTGENRSEILDGMLTREQRKFMKSMKTFPSVLRTEYAYALLAEGNAAKAENILAQFEKCAKTYPYPNDIQFERELMERAQQRV